jgi:hypothetical protein
MLLVNKILRFQQLRKPIHKDSYFMKIINNITFRVCLKILYQLLMIKWYKESWQPMQTFRNKFNKFRISENDGKYLINKLSDASIL